MLVLCSLFSFAFGLFGFVYVSCLCGCRRCFALCVLLRVVLLFAYCVVADVDYYVAFDYL